jgi:hypothetical protein
MLRVRQCFKCYEYGYIAKYCRKTARCGHCAAAAHEQKNENACFNKQPNGKKKCVNCKGSHTAWNRACPAYKNASEKAKEAYTHRLRQFVVASTTASTSESNKGRMFLPFITQLSSSDGYTTVSRKKERPPSRTVSITRSQSRASSSQPIQDYIRPRIGHAATSQPSFTQ